MEQDALPGSDAVFGPSATSVVSGYEFNCEPWTLKRSNSLESVQLSVSNSLNPDLTSTLNVTCTFDACSNNVAAKLRDLTKAS